jgi:hypothetical protein
MHRKLIITIQVVLVIIPSLLWANDLSSLGNILGPGSQIPCGANQSDPGMPECPNCVSLDDTVDPFLHEYTETYQFKTVSLSIPIAPEVLLDQGYVRSIFRPPTSIL